MQLQDSITKLKGIGEKKAEPFAKAGVHTIKDLLEYYPRAYDTFDPPVECPQIESGNK